MRFTYALHMCGQNRVPLACLCIKSFELVIEIIFHYCTMPLCSATKLIYSYVHSGAAPTAASGVENVLWAGPRLITGKRF